MTHSTNPTRPLESGVGRMLFFLASMSLLLYPTQLPSPYIKPYFAILIIVEAAALYCIVRLPVLLLDKGLACAVGISLISSIMMVLQSGLANLRDYIWFNYFVIVSLSGYLLLRAWVIDGRSLEKVIRLILISSFVMCGIEYYEALVGATIVGSNLPTTQSAATFRPGSLIGNPNPLGAFCGAAAVLAFNRLLIRFNTLNIAALMANLVGTGLTLSRGDAIGLLLGLCISVGLHIFSGWRRQLRTILVSSTCVLIALLFLGYAGNVSAIADRFSDRLKDENAVYRIEQWRAALGELDGNYAAFAFGMGPGSSAAYYGRGVAYEIRQDLTGANTFDNSGVSILYQYGVAGLVASLFPFALLAWKVIRLRDSNENWRLGVSTVIFTSCAFFEIFPYFACSYVLCLCFIWPSNRGWTAQTALAAKVPARAGMARVTSEACRSH